MASVNMPVPQGKKTKKVKASTVVVDTLLKGQTPKVSKEVDKNIPDSVFKEIARRQPLRAVFIDSSFAEIPTKINVGEIQRL